MRYLALIVPAVLCLAFLACEMFPWRNPRIFRSPKALGGDFAKNIKDPKIWSANQGLYNGFLALGLIWALSCPNGQMKYDLARFFLTCMLIAGIFGAKTVARSFLLFQATPAAIFLVFVWFAMKPE
jgi:putative membrane protein